MEKNHITSMMDEKKKDIVTRAIIIHKARLNIDDSRMKQAIHCDETCAPVAQ